MTIFKDSKSDVLNDALDMRKGELFLAQLTTTERNNQAVEHFKQGAMIFNTTVDKVQVLISLPAGWYNLDMTAA